MSGVKRVVFMLDGCVHCEPLSSAWDHLPRYVLASDYDRDTQTLKDELDNIKRSWGLLHSERDALRAQVEAMRDDAERYRWMRASFVRNHNHSLTWYLPWTSPLTANGLDANVDNARRTKP